MWLQLLLWGAQALRLALSQVAASVFWWPEKGWGSLRHAAAVTWPTFRVLQSCVCIINELASVARERWRSLLCFGRGMQRWSWDWKQENESWMEIGQTWAVVRKKGRVRMEECSLSWGKGRRWAGTMER